MKSNNIGVIGKPKYRLGDSVRFAAYNEETKEGDISIVDAFGTWDQKKEPSYDILIKSENLLCKHVRESSIIDCV